MAKKDVIQHYTCYMCESVVLARNPNKAYYYTFNEEIDVCNPCFEELYHRVRRATDKIFAEVKKECDDTALKFAEESRRQFEKETGKPFSKEALESLPPVERDWTPDWEYYKKYGKKSKPLKRGSLGITTCIYCNKTGEWNLDLMPRECGPIVTKDNGLCVDCYYIFAHEVNKYYNDPANEFKDKATQIKELKEISAQLVLFKKTIESKEHIVEPNSESE